MSNERHNREINILTKRLLILPQPPGTSKLLMRLSSSARAQAPMSAELIILSVYVRPIYVQTYVSYHLTLSLPTRVR